MYECERNPISNPRDDMMRHSACTAISAESAKIAHSLTSSKLNRDFFDNPQTSGTILECLAESSLKDSRDILKSSVLVAYFRAFYLARGRHLRASKILVLLAKNHKTKLKIPAFLRGHCALPSLNSSLGNQFAQILVLPASLRRMPNTPHSQGFSVAQSNTANTKIVGGEIQDSKVNSESPLSDSHSISESYPHASLESPVDSEPTSAVGHCPTAIESSFSSERSLEQALEASSGWGIVKGEGATSQFKPLPLNKKENIESKEVLESKEAKAKDFERLDLESEMPKIQEAATKDSKALDLESKRRVESAGARDSEKQALESEKLEFATDLESAPSVIASQALQSIKTDSKKSESSPKDFKSHLESNPKDSKAIAESTTSDSHSITESCVDSLVDSSPILSESASPLTCERKLAKQSIKQDSKKSKSSLDLESQTTKNKDSQLDSKTMDCHDFAPAKSRNDKKTETKPLFFRINSHSTIAESTSNAHIKAHSLYFTYKRGYYA